MRRLLWAALFAVGACTQSPSPAREEAVDTEPTERTRLQMVSGQIESRGVRDPEVLRAMRKVPRHRFVPPSQQRHAYEDRPLPIGHQQTISQPYIVALMTELAAVKPGDRVLEVGTGSGYQAAVLAELGVSVFSVEIVEPLAERADATLQELGYEVEVRHGDGYAGWPEHAPFDAIVVTAAPPRIPEALKQQLKPGAHLVIPVGRNYQSLKLVTRTHAGFREQDVLPVRFVPMTGKAQTP
jgi:protein-L-isoaspartate(D-aspartate) O-methyltransferase